ncbi:MAG TPA: hypothetical protein VG826_18180 [Pirellulales bacterium]|nr:hypothetical protein [Pirellulales bacterium]
MAVFLAAFFFGDFLTAFLAAFFLATLRVLRKKSVSLAEENAGQRCHDEDPGARLTVTKKRLPIVGCGEPKDVTPVARNMQLSVRYVVFVRF